MKRLLRANPVQALIAGLAALYMRIVYATGRWTLVAPDSGRAVFEGDQPFLGCFWHGRMLMWPSYWAARKPIMMLISDHQDGRLIARTIAHFGIGTVKGSSSRGGAMALRGIAQWTAEGRSVVVTPDGPRGPRMRAAPGIAMAAKLTGAAIVPSTYSTSRAITLRSWDRFLLALPFGRGVFMLGEPIYLARDADAAAVEAARLAVERQLNELTREADRLCGRKPVEPAAEPQRLAPA
jgi:hypothetical protein